MSWFKKGEKMEEKEVDRFVIPGKPEKTVTYEAGKPHIFRRLSDGTIQEKYEDWDEWHTWRPWEILESIARHIGQAAMMGNKQIEPSEQWMIEEPIRCGRYIIRIEEVKE